MTAETTFCLWSMVAYLVPFKTLKEPEPTDLGSGLFLLPPKLKTPFLSSNSSFADQVIAAVSSSSTRPILKSRYFSGPCPMYML